MKGLILKDLINLKKQFRIIGLIVCFYFIIGFTSGDMSMLGGLSILLFTMMSITALAYDEQAKWDSYALSMPITRKDIVFGKYLLGIMLNLAGSILVFIVYTIATLIDEKFINEDFFKIIITLSVLGILLFSIIMPILFKLGVEKGRLVMMAIFLVPTLIGMFIGKLGIEPPSEEFLNNLPYLFLLITIVVLVISIFISIKVYEKKEL